MPPQAKVRGRKGAEEGGREGAGRGLTRPCTGMGNFCCKPPPPPPYDEVDELTPLVKSPKSLEGWVLTVAKPSHDAGYVIEAISTMAATRGDSEANPVSVRFNELHVSSPASSSRMFSFFPFVFDDSPPLRTVNAFSLRRAGENVNIALASQVASAMPMIEKMGPTPREIDALEMMVANFMAKGVRPRTIEL